MLRELVGRRRLPLTVLLWLMVVLLVGWALRVVPPARLLEALERLHLLQIAALFVVNAAVIASFAGRWLVILRAQGEKVPFVALAAYRLAAFGLSYFTPGPQVGGEPLQVILLRRRHGIGGPTATASVVLDRGLDLAVNLAVLAAGIVVASRGALAGVQPGPGATVGAAALVGLSAALVLSIGTGRRPLHALLARLPGEPPEGGRVRGILDFALQSEAESARFCREQPGAVAWALLVSALSWALMLAELGLALRALGLVLTPAQVAAVLVAMRVAFLLPSPGGLGTLEAGQVLAFQAMGLDPAAGLSLSLIIRARDMLFGATGLWLGGVLLGKRWSNRQVR